MSTLYGVGRYASLRYALIVEMLAAFAPAMRVKGRANDPLRHASWWTVDQHSAVLVVCLAAVAGVALVYLAMRKGVRNVWACLGCGLFAGEFPAMFYGATAPGDIPVPQAALWFDGTLYGLIAGAALYLLLRSQAPAVTATPGPTGQVPRE